MSNYPQGSYGFQQGDPHDNREADVKDRFSYWLDEVKDEIKPEYLAELEKAGLGFDQKAFEAWAWEYWETRL